jgi:4-carboxymuconolactone decarboxylase
MLKYLSLIPALAPLACTFITLISASLMPFAALHAQTSPPPTSSPQQAWPADIDPQSGFRLPLLRREELDDDGKKVYDRAMTPGANIAGLQGPSAVHLYSPKTAIPLGQSSGYLRTQAKYPAPLREIAILITAREMDSQFEWVAHEPEARKNGVPEEVINVIKYRRPTTGLDAKDAFVITLGRQIWHDHKVTPAVFAEGKDMFGAPTLIDLVLLMGNYAGTAALLTSVDMQLHRGEHALLPIP